jgi:uncharacterized protein YndB with AHSA1/START domain
VGHRSEPDAGALCTVRIVKRLRATPSRVFDAWVDPLVARQWLFATAAHPIDAAEIDARVGGAFRLVDRRDGTRIEYGGRYLAIVPARRLVFTLAWPNAGNTLTRVAADFEARGVWSTLTVVHQNLPAALASAIKGRWTGMLYGLQLLLAAGARRGELFGDDQCRFGSPPIDYTMDPPRFAAF